MPGVDLGIWVAAIKIRIHKPESMKKYILDLTVSAIEAIHEKYVLIKLTQEAPLPPMLWTTPRRRSSAGLFPLILLMSLPMSYGCW